MLVHEENGKRSCEERKYFRDRILKLDGLPNLQDLGKLLIGENLLECLGCDLKLERAAQSTIKDGIAQLIATEGVHAYEYRGRRYDCGSKQGFLEATVEFALKHPEIGPAFGEYLVSRNDVVGITLVFR